jgi:hypothetical protein
MTHPSYRRGRGLTGGIVSLARPALFAAALSTAESSAVFPVANHATPCQQSQLWSRLMLAAYWKATFDLLDRRMFYTVTPTQCIHCFLDMDVWRRAGRLMPANSGYLERLLEVIVRTTGDISIIG